MGVKDIIKPMVVLGALFFFALVFINEPSSAGEILTYLSYTATFATVTFIVYERWLWRWIPYKRPPILKRYYDGELEYIWKKVLEKKPICIEVKQSLFSVRISTKTDINKSNSITASLVHEHGNYYLYYTYITSPDATIQKTNPIQHGACRMALLNGTHRVEGNYWTSSSTVGKATWIANDKMAGQVNV